MAEQTADSQTVITPMDGVRFEIRIRSHTLVVDQTVRGGGMDSAPTPLDLLGASLGSCVAYFVQEALRARGLPAEGLKVTVGQVTAKGPSRIENFKVTVKLGEGISEANLAILSRVIEACPAHNTLKLTTGIETTFEVETNGGAKE